MDQYAGVNTFLMIVTYSKINQGACRGIKYLYDRD